MGISRREYWVESQGTVSGVLLDGKGVTNTPLLTQLICATTKWLLRGRAGREDFSSEREILELSSSLLAENPKGV